jgi:hypothetical protein
MAPVSLRARWMLLSTFARSNVASSGGHGPACRPYEHVLQILMHERGKREESWTVYRDRENKRGEGKVLFKRWNAKTDRKKLQELDGKSLPEGWHNDTSVVWCEYAVSSHWVENLYQELSAISVPPVAGSFRDSLGGVKQVITIWRGEQECKFSWRQRPPPEWKPLADFILALRKTFQQRIASLPLDKGPAWPLVRD